MKYQIKNTIKKLFVFLICSILSSCLVVSINTKDQPPQDTSNICSIFQQKPNWKESAKSSQKKWGVPLSILMAVIYQESSFKSTARPTLRNSLGVNITKSSAYGYAQAKDETWDWYRAKTKNTFARRDDFDDAVDFVGWYHHMSKRLANIPSNAPYSLYLAYHEGHGGFKRKTWQKKPWLVKVAKKVAKRSRLYHKQLRACP